MILSRHQIKGVFRSPALWYMLAVGIFAACTQIPLVLRVLHASPGFIFNLDHGMPLDYNVYLSAITLGRNGFWFFRNPFTSEPSPWILTYEPYVILGALGRWTGLPSSVLYHTAKMTCMAAYAAAVYGCCRIVIGKKWFVWAAILAMFVSVGPPVLFSRFTIYPWWTVFMQANTRFDNVPHYLLAETCLLLTVAWTFRARSSGKHQKWIIPAAVSSFLCALTLPTAALPVVIGFPAAQFVEWVSGRIRGNKSPGVNRIVVTLLPVLTALVAVWIIQSQIRMDPAWKNYSYEIGLWNRSSDFFWSMLASFSVPGILALPALISAILNPSFDLVFLLVWTIYPFLMLPFTTSLHLGNLRLIQGAPFVPLGILASITLFRIIGNGKKPVVARNVVLVLVLLYSAVMSGSYIAKLVDEAESEPMYSNVYLGPDYFDLSAYLNRTVPPGTVILTDPMLGNILPALSPVRTFVGHPGQTVDYETKRWISSVILSGIADQATFDDLLNVYRYRYIATRSPLRYAHTALRFTDGIVYLYETGLEIKPLQKN